jgi:hypothetical protein
MRSRVRESLVREGVRANLIAGVRPSEAAIVDAAAARGVEVVRSHHRDIQRGGARRLRGLRLGRAPARDRPSPARPRDAGPDPRSLGGLLAGLPRREGSGRGLRLALEAIDRHGRSRSSHGIVLDYLPEGPGGFNGK